ncbi:hypothetical protein [Pararhodobacter oceanensis]|uniref:hypothetical protein n=1 Tax=Pararhodobacter oceanensis TaxID=2172121 RepID=UPI003A9008C2
MEIALHLGVHLTDNDQLVRCLMRNRGLLAQQGIAVPPTGSYRMQLRQLSHDMADQTTDAATQEALLDGLLEADDVRRVVFSSEYLLATHQWIVVNDQFYPNAGKHLAQAVHLFPEAEVRVYLALRNPAHFLPALIKDERSGGAATVLKNSDPLNLRWSEMLLRMHDAAPDVPITLWCEEDTPLLWPEILQTVSGHAPETELEGWFAWYWEMMTPKTHEAMRRYFNRNPVVDAAHRRRILAAMLEKFARPEARREAGAIDAPLPGWSGEYIDVLTELYQQDLDLISAIPGVTLLEP